MILNLSSYLVLLLRNDHIPLSNDLGLFHLNDNSFYRGFDTKIFPEGPSSIQS